MNNLLTEEIFLKRFNSLPDHIREILSSERAQNIAIQIGKSHYLNKEKIESLNQIIASILMGFISLRNLKREISDKLFLNYDHTIALANDLNQEFFGEIKNELEQIYSPIEEEVTFENTEKLDKQTPIEEVVKEKKEDISIEIPIKEELNLKSVNKPLVLVEKNTPQMEHEVEKSKFKDFSKSFSFFVPKENSIEKKPAMARVIAPKEKKVVHYNELRSPISSFNKNEDFIDLTSQTKTVESVDKEKKIGNIDVTEINLTKSFNAIEKKEPSIIKEVPKNVSNGTEKPTPSRNTEVRQQELPQKTKKSPKIFNLFPKGKNAVGQKPEKDNQQDGGQEEIKIEGNKIDLRNI